MTSLVKHTMQAERRGLVHDFRDILGVQVREVVADLLRGRMLSRVLATVWNRNLFRYLSRWFVIIREGSLFVCRISVPDKSGVRREGYGTGLFPSIAKFMALRDLAEHYELVMVLGRYRLYSITTMVSNSPSWLHGNKCNIDFLQVLKRDNLSGLNRSSNLPLSLPGIAADVSGSSVLLHAFNSGGDVGSSRIWRRKIEFVTTAPKVAKSAVAVLPNVPANPTKDSKQNANKKGAPAIKAAKPLVVRSGPVGRIKKVTLNCSSLPRPFPDIPRFDVHKTTSDKDVWRRLENRVRRRGDTVSMVPPFYSDDELIRCTKLQVPVFFHRDLPQYTKLIEDYLERTR